MKKSFLSAVAVAALFAANPADARRGGGGHAEGLLFIAETTHTDANGAPLSLCILERTEKVMFFPVWRSAKEYVMAGNRCETDEFYSLNDGGFSRGQLEGVFPADLPAEPELSTAQLLQGSWGAAIALPLIILGLAIRFLGNGSGKPRGKDNSFVGRAIQAMALVAKADGSVSNEEIAVMRNVVAQLTKVEVPMQEVANLVAQCPSEMTDRQLRQLGKGLDQAHRDLLIQAATMVAASDGAFENAENHVMYRMSKALKVTGEKLDGMIAQTVPVNAVPAE